MTSIGIFGAGGRMGRAIAAVAMEAGLPIAGGTDRAPEGEIAPGIAISADPLALAERADVLIDFSVPGALSAHLDACIAALAVPPGGGPDVNVTSEACAGAGAAYDAALGFPVVPATISFAEMCATIAAVSIGVSGAASSCPIGSFGPPRTLAVGVAATLARSEAAQRGANRPPCGDHVRGRRSLPTPRSPS